MFLRTNCVNLRNIFEESMLMQTSENNRYELPESLARHLGIELICVEDGYVKATMPVDKRTSRPCSPTDILNGGAHWHWPKRLPDTVHSPSAVPTRTPAAFSQRQSHQNGSRRNLRRGSRTPCTPRKNFARMEHRRNHPRRKSRVNGTHCQSDNKQTLMNLPDIPIIRIIDRMTRSNTCFALYRLPWTDEPILVLQQDAPAETMDSLEQLNGKSGFLLAPFSKPDRHPIVLIRPDRVVRDWSDIGSTLLEFESACSWENLEEAQEASAQNFRKGTATGLYGALRTLHRSAA